LAYSNIYLKGGGGEIVPNIIGSSINKVIGKEIDNVNIEACFLENAGEEAMIQRWEKLYDVKG